MPSDLGAIGGFGPVGDAITYEAYGLTGLTEWRIRQCVEKVKRVGQLGTCERCQTGAFGGAQSVLMLRTRAQETHSGKDFDYESCP
jgi:hypothetical protein